MNKASIVTSKHSRKSEGSVASKIKTVNIMLVGCGPHAKRVYIPALGSLKMLFNINLKVVVELEGMTEATKEVVGSTFGSVDYIFTQPFTDAYKIPRAQRARLDNAVDKHKINAIIIATEPLSHMQYALWAIDKGLHVLMDKPISTHKNVANSVAQANKLTADFAMLATARNPAKAFIINTQRRYHPGFQYAFDQVSEVASKYGIPITSMQSTNCDGQWRLPKEVLTQGYHPYIGYGKVSHSGYHIIDVISNFIQSSFTSSGKVFDKISTYSSFVRPTGMLYQQNRDDYLRVFGEQYEEVNEFSDKELSALYKKAGEAEVDSSSLITLFNQGHTIANVSLNLMHNGFTRRDWILPGGDLYKGNGRVKHEYHNIEQGPYQNIQIHSYQANDKHDVSTQDDYSLGGNNHFDIYVFRNSGVLGGKPLRVIRNSDLVAQMNFDNSKLVIEQVKHRVVQEFIEVVLGKRDPASAKSDLATHALSARMMSLIYKSGIKRKEVVVNYV